MAAVSITNFGLTRFSDGTKATIFAGVRITNSFFFDTQKGHKSFQLVTIDWSYHFYDAPIIICFNHINIVASMIRQRVDVDISRSWLKIDYLFVD